MKLLGTSHCVDRPNYCIALACFLVLLLGASVGSAVSVAPEEMQPSREWLEPYTGNQAQPLFSFNCDGKPWVHGSVASTQTQETRGTRHELIFRDASSSLQVRCSALQYKDFPTVEWTLYFRNTGSNDTAIISDIQALDAILQRHGKAEFSLHHWAGSQATIDDYRPFVTPLESRSVHRFHSSGGRGSDGVWPYFNIDWGTEGAILAIGWPGQWAARFARPTKLNLHVTAGQEATHFLLHPGEEVRSPLMVLQFWKGGDWIRAQNIWRQWMRAYNLPRLNGELPPPLFPASSANQLSEMQHANEQNQMQFIDGYADRGVPLSFWWMDAGWYEFHQGWWNVGTWEVDRQRFPHGLRAVSDHAHAKGVKTLLWFEPERVTPGTWLYTNRSEWLLGANGRQKLLDLGNPTARQWVIDHVDKVMREEGIDIYRQDFNFEPLGYWQTNDTPDRQGISEIRHVTGYLAFWDELRRRHPGLLIDTCASGGRRNDLETLRRSVPLHKSDMAYPDLIAKQTQLSGIAFWVPYFGAPVYPAERVDVYGFRSGIAPMTGIGYDSRLPDLDYALLRRLLGEWRKAAPIILNGDYYPLTSWSAATDFWAAYQFDWPEKNEGLVQAFRRPDSPYETARFRLGGLVPDAHYEVSNADAAGTTSLTGRELAAEGLFCQLTNRPSSALFFYRRVAQ